VACAHCCPAWEEEGGWCRRDGETSEEGAGRQRRPASGPARNDAAVSIVSYCQWQLLRSDCAFFQ
jgi:hypothetical protein